MMNLTLTNAYTLYTRKKKFAVTRKIQKELAYQYIESFLNLSKNTSLLQITLCVDLLSAHPCQIGC